MPAQPTRSPLEQALAAALASSTSHAATAAAAASPPPVTTGAAAAPHLFSAPPGSSSAESQTHLAGARNCQLKSQLLGTSSLCDQRGICHATHLQVFHSIMLVAVRRSEDFDAVIFSAWPLVPISICGAAGAAGPVDLQAASSTEPPAHEQTSVVPGARDTSAVKIEAVADLNEPPAGSPVGGGDAAANVSPTGMTLPAVAVSNLIGSADAELAATPVEAVQPDATGAGMAASVMPETGTTPAAMGASGPSRPNPTRPKFEPRVWELHQAFSARDRAQGGYTKQDPAASNAVARPAAARAPETSAIGLATDAAAVKAAAEPVASDVPTVGAAADDAAAGKAPAVASCTGEPRAAAPAPLKPRFRHSSITWQLHSAAMARRDDAAAQLAAGLAAKPIEEETGTAETADDEESGGLQVRLRRLHHMLVKRQQKVPSRSLLPSNAAQRSTDARHLAEGACPSPRQRHMAREPR